jgi:hypothetical protein
MAIVTAASTTSLDDVPTGANSGLVAGAGDPALADVALASAELATLDLSEPILALTQPSAEQLMVRPLSLDVAVAAEDGLFDGDAEWRLVIAGGPSVFRFRNDSVDDGETFRFNQPAGIQSLPLGGEVNFAVTGTESDTVVDDVLPGIDFTMELNSPVRDLIVSSTVEGGVDAGLFLTTPLDARYTMSWEVDYDGAQTALPSGLGQLTARLVGLEIGGAAEDGPFDTDAEWVLDIGASAVGVTIFGGFPFPSIGADRFTFEDDSVIGGDVFDAEVNDQVVVTGQFPLGTQLALFASGREVDVAFDDELPASNVVLGLNSQFENLRISTRAEGGVDNDPFVDDPGSFSYILTWEIDFLFA